MKKLMFTAFAALAAGLAAWADVDMNLVEKELQTVTIPFGIRSYTPSNKDVIRIEKVSDTSLRITALKAGRCDIEVRGDMELTEKYHISVGGPLPQLLGWLQRDLEKVPEVSADINGNKIRISGTVKSIKKWNYLMKVLNDDQYKGSVSNFAEFELSDDLKLRMKASLQQCGLDVSFNEAFTGDWNTWKANTVALSTSRENRTLLVQAKVYDPATAKMIEECFKREKRWIKIDTEDKDSFDDEKQVYANLQIHVAKPQIRLSVAYMALSTSDISKIGNKDWKDALGIDMAFQTIQNLLHGGGNHGNQAQLTANLHGTMSFLAQNGVNKVSNIGYTQIESWAPNGAQFKSGGTRFVRVYGRDVAELKEIPYGFTIDAKGGLIDEKTLDVNFDFGLSTIIPMDDETYDRKEDLSKQKIRLQLGRTTLISGFMDLVDRHQAPSGLPFLRNTPILNWFVSEESNEVTDRKLVIMVCPEIVDPTKDGTIDVDNPINKPLAYYKDTPSKEIDKSMRKKHKGFWSWLDWFSF